jgi:tetratricopeptide (TPR) repeat protein
MGRHEEALSHLDRARQLKPDDLEVSLRRSAALYALGRLDESAQVCEEAIAAGAPYAAFHAQLAQIRFDQGRYQESLDQAREAVEREPANAKYIGFLGRLSFHLGDYQTAARVLEQALTLDPTSTRDRLYAGRAWALAGSPERALQLLEAEPRGDLQGAPIRQLADSLRRVAR